MILLKGCKMTDREYEMQVDRQMQSEYTEYRNKQRAKSYEELLKDENVELKKIIEELKKENEELKEELESEKDYANYLEGFCEYKTAEYEKNIEKIKKEKSITMVERLYKQIKQEKEEFEYQKKQLLYHFTSNEEQLYSANRKINELIYQLKECQKHKQI